MAQVVYHPWMAGTTSDLNKLLRRMRGEAVPLGVLGTPGITDVLKGFLEGVSTGFRKMVGLSPEEQKALAKVTEEYTLDLLTRVKRLRDDLGTGVLARTSSGTLVRELQAIINEVLGFKITVDGTYGPTTESCVKELQRVVGAGIDGQFGPGTASKLVNYIIAKTEQKEWWRGLTEIFTGTIDTIWGKKEEQIGLTEWLRKLIITEGGAEKVPSYGGLPWVTIGIAGLIGYVVYRAVK